MLQDGIQAIKNDPSEAPSIRNKRQRIMETWSGDTHLSPPGGSSLEYSRKRNTDPLSSSVTGANHASTGAVALRPSEALKAALPPGQYDHMRLAILRHQELFLGQLYDLHHTVQLQRHLVSICSHRAAMDAELAKLEAEQEARRNTISDVTVEQEDGTDAVHASMLAQGSNQALQSNGTTPALRNGTPAASSRNPNELQAGSTTSQPHTAAEPPPPAQMRPNLFPHQKPAQQNMDQQAAQGSQQQQQQQQQGRDMLKNAQGMWPGMFPQGYPLQYSQPSMAFNGWGMPMMGGGFGGGFANPYGMPFGMMTPAMDPMMAWYALHYGQYAHAMQNQANANAANARRQAQEQQEGAAAAAAGEKEKADDSQARQNLRWWQDPEKVFGIAANPAIVGNPPPSNTRQKPNKKAEMQTEVTSKPPEQRRSKNTSVKDHKSPSKQLKTNSKARANASAGSEPKDSHQKAGSGLSAFKKLPTKSLNVRRPPTRAESIGSEVSRSAAEVDRSPADGGESSGVNHAAAAKVS